MRHVLFSRIIAGYSVCLITLLGLSLLGGCSEDDTQIPEQSVSYRLTFDATWSAQTHPVDFPGNPHFSGLIGATHNVGVRLWEEGETASPGIQNMAETGSKSPLDDEIAALIAAGGACLHISGDGVQKSPGVAAVTFTINRDCPQVSVVSMIAPSPDWFVGVSGLNLRENGKWLETKTVQLFPYDAGTDSGATYISINQPMVVPEPIYRIESEPFLFEGSVSPLGTFTFTLLQ